MNKKDKEKLENIDYLIKQTEGSIEYIKAQIRYYHEWYKINKKQIKELESLRQEIEKKEE